MRVTFTAILVLLALGAVAPDAEAKCRWEFVCDAAGNCRQEPLCDSTLDVPMPAMPRVAPVVPPVVEPIPMPRVPPVGTSACQQVRVCNSFGQCRWQTVCR